MNIIKSINMKKISIAVFVIIILFPAEIATSTNNINNEKEYIICKISTATDVDYDVVYDSQGRNIDSIKVKNRLLNIFTKAKVPRSDPYCNLNKYIIYTDSNVINGNVLTIEGIYKANILYPIKREKHNNKLSEWCLFWFEVL